MEKPELYPGGETKRDLKQLYRIRHDDKVLDVGCGEWPFPLATHLADFSLEDNKSRFASIPKQDRPLLECSVEALPFRDKAFDFVYCAHVLEHIQNPGAACLEIMRVGKRGYIECPRSWIEYVFPSSDHNWLVDLERNCLVFREILEEERKDILGLQIPFLFLSEDEEFKQYWKFRIVRQVRNVEFYWEDRFDYLVIPKEERKNAGSFRAFYERPCSDGMLGQLPKVPQYLKREILRTIRKRV